MTLSKLHPSPPVFALTDKEQVAQQLVLWRGVIPLVVESISQADGVDIAIGRELQARGLVPEDESIIVVGAAPQGPPGETNFIRLLTID
jgi:pyruvate kinase